MPEAYVRELEPLCMECPVSDFESIKKTLIREYGRPLEEIFSEIDPVPIGSASLAQVHKAKLLDGTKVAIKVIKIFNRNIIL
jgi:ubiquinone biosynthesis protein